MKNIFQKRRFTAPPVSFGKAALLYPILVIASLVFAQTVKMPVSHMIFIFVLMLPLVSIIPLVVARLCIVADLQFSDTTVVKKASVKIQISIQNKSPLPFPLVCPIVWLPCGGAPESLPNRLICSLIPFSTCQIEKNIKFPLRGEYDVELCEIYVYDLFRAVKLRIPVKCCEKISVLPREVALGVQDRSADFGEERFQTLSRERKNVGEPSFVRPYEVGDSPKNVHWKLSSKSEELMVKEFTGEGRQTVWVICDLEAHILNSSRSESPKGGYSQGEYSIEDEIRDYTLGDLAVEGTLAVCRRELSLGRDVAVLWIEGVSVASVLIHSEREISEHLRPFYMAKLSEIKNHPTRLSKAVGYTVFVTSYLDEDAAVEYAALASSSNELVFCYDGENKIPGDVNYKLSSLANMGMNVVELSIK